MSDKFYKAFEDKYRGSREDIKKRLKVYLPFVNAVKHFYPGGLTLDLGCGRGEWLELLKELGAETQGVDLDDGMLESCRELGLNAEKGDILAYIKKIPNEACSVITAFHVVEHLQFEVVTELVSECLRVLKPGGILILETPNPENITVGTASFYIDPTHYRPLPIELLSFIPSYVGYFRVKVLRLQESAELHNRRPITLLDVLAGVSPDYGVIAQKLAGPEILDRTQPCFDEDYGLDLLTLASRYESRCSTTEERLHQALELSATVSRDLVDMRKELHLALSKISEMERGFVWRITTRFRWLTVRIKHLGYLIKANDASGMILLLSKVHFFRRLAGPVLRRTPKLRARLIEILSASPVVARAPIRSYAKAEDYVDIVRHKFSSIRVSALAESSVNLQISESALAKCVLRIDGHFNGSYSLAAVNRNIVHRIRAHNNCSEIYISPREGEPSKGITNVPGGDAEASILNGLIVNGELDCDKEIITLYHHYPLVEEIPSAVKFPVLMFFWEESRLPKSTIDQINSNYIGVLVTSWFVKKVLIDCGCVIPISVINLPLIGHFGNGSNFSYPLAGEPIRLLHVSSCFPRKGVDVLLRAFDEIASVVNVTLTIKTFHNVHNNAGVMINELVSSANQHRITLVMDELDAGGMERLYKNAHVVVLPTRGEGLNLPAIEAAMYSKPLVLTGFGAHTDFFAADDVWYIPYRFDYAASHLASSLSVWADPSKDSLVQILKSVCSELRNGLDAVDKKLVRNKERIERIFFSESSVRSFIGALLRIKSFDLTKPDLTVSIMSTWNEPCGIAEYSKNVANALSDREVHVQLLVPKGVRGENVKSSLNVVECWEKGQAPKLNDFSICGNVVWLQHHFAFYGLDGELEKNVQCLQAKGKLVYITLHSTRPLLGFTAEPQLAASSCLNSFERVFVHTLDDLNNLKRLGVVDNVTMMPQGVKAPKIFAGPSHTRGKASFRIGAFGFLLEHKGFLKLIEAFAELVSKQSQPPLRLRLVTAVLDTPASHAERDRCADLIASRGIAALIEWHTEFLPSEEVEYLLSGCDAVVLPYQFTQESSSAAVRTAIACCPYVGTTPAPIFDEVRSVTYEIDGFATENIRNFIEKASCGFGDPNMDPIQVERSAWIKERDWNNIGEAYSSLFIGAKVNQDFLGSGLKPNDIGSC